MIRKCTKIDYRKSDLFSNNVYDLYFLKVNSPAPFIDDWKVMGNSSVNFLDMIFFIFCNNLAKNEEKHVMEIYG